MSAPRSNEIDLLTPEAKARLTASQYDREELRDLHVIADGDCVERCPACAAEDLLAALHALYPPDERSK